MDPLDIRLGIQIIGLVVTGTGIVVGFKFAIKALQTAVIGHVKDKAVHMSVEEKVEIGVVKEQTENNEKFIKNLREDMNRHEQNVRKDLGISRAEFQLALKDGLDRIHETIRNSNK